MRCLVTGASGHVGAALVRQLVQRGADVTIMARPTSDLWRLADVQRQLNIVPGDLADPVAARDALIAAAPEVVFHLAWYGVTANQRNEAAQITRNVSGTLALWEIAHAAGCGCWIGVGSQAEYGPYQGVLNEELPTKPVTAYGVAKLHTGTLTQKLCEMAGMRYVWLRLLATYGPQDDERHLIPSVIRQLLARDVPKLTPGEQLWDYLYVDDAAEALYRVAANKQAQGVYVLGSGEAYAVREIVERIRDGIDPALPLAWGALPYGWNQSMQLQADIRRLRAVVDWKPQTTLDQGLQRTITWYSTHDKN